MPRMQKNSASRKAQHDMDADGDLAAPLRLRAAVSYMTLLCILLLIRRKEPRTRQLSRFDEFYSRMRDDEFRATFRVPRPLFNVIVDDMRAD